MRRRRRHGEVPEYLATFREGDWPGRTWDIRFAFWREARRAYLEEHGSPADPIVLLRAESDVRRRHRGWRLLPFDRTPEELARLNMTGDPHG